ncbi:ATP-binding cassette sub- B member 6, mitochondrial, partial [Linnemannia schmuckeri]
GSTVGIVGPTGSGKSTLLKLMFRLWDPTSGRILIDGQDISKVTQTSVRGQIGVVPQDTTLFDESILYNIGYARPSATRAEIEDAAKAAHVHDNIMTFEKGYDTSVGERGANVTESDIQKALRAVTESRTTFVVAHRLSTVMHADLILFIKDGRIVERGTHEELIQRAVENDGKGEYYMMWRIQSGENVSPCAPTIGDDEPNPLASTVKADVFATTNRNVSSESKETKEENVTKAEE